MRSKYIKRKWDLGFLIFGALLCLYSFAAIRYEIKKAEVFSFSGGTATLVIDPGHGGRDGGAISDSGVKESDINLAIALKTDKLAKLFGLSTLLTRSDDSSSAEMEHYSEHDDLVHRSRVASDAVNGVLISIHQDKFISPQPSGPQVLYADNSKSETLGKLLQANLSRSVAPENRRVATKAPDKLYLTANTQCPTILIECGFMSNPEDLKKLTDDGYQTALSSVLVSSYIQFISGSFAG